MINMSANIKPYLLNITENELLALYSRLNNTRLPDQPPGEPWLSGTDLDWFKTILEYWKKDFDWKKSEAELNTFPQFKTNISDIDIHFIYS